ncbi:MAG: DUF4129 domain-containing transglutaminase family protein [Candidatus Dormibacteria bacterium]
MNPVALAAVAALAIGGLMMAGVVRLRLSEGALEIGAGREGRLRHFQVDLGEGLLSDFCLFFVVSTTAVLVASSNWVPGTSVLVPMMVTATVVALVLAKAAPRGTTYWLAAEVGAVLALFTYTASHGANPASDFVTWVRAIRASVSLASLVTMCGAGWMIVAWSVFWVAHKRNTALALAPLAIVLAVEIINDPGQPGNGALMVMWLLLAGTLMLRLNAARIHDRWSEMADSHVWISISTRGALAVVVLLVIAIVLPPLNSVDLSVAMFHGRSPTGGDGPADSAPGRTANQPVPNLTQTGYSERVAPGGTLVRSQVPVLQVSTGFGRQVYWRGINLYSVVDGIWSPGPARAVTSAAGSNALLDRGTDAARQTVRAVVNVLDVPQSTIFWPGEPIQVNQPTTLRSAASGSLSGVATVEAAYARSAVPVGQSYVVQASQSVATEDQLRAAGTLYPAGVAQVTGLVPSDRNPTTTIGTDVSDLGRQVSGTGSVYDQVKNIETYLRTTEKYQLRVSAPPSGVEPISYFLFKSHTGYCEYFASAMGQMVRALGVPVRLVSGYGPGSATQPQDITPNFKHEVGAGAIVTTIRAADAHTWVEVYFPKYGWVPFEPTPDPNYPLLTRGTGPAPVVAPVTGTALPPVIAPPVRHVTVKPGPAVPAVLGLGFTAVVALALLAILLTRVAVGTESGDLRLAWSRLGWLGFRSGVARRPSDTPLEFAARLATRLPDLADDIMVLGGAYGRHAYGTGAARGSASDSEVAAWLRVRSRLVRLLALGPGRGGVSPRAATPQS